MSKEVSNFGEKGFPPHHYITCDHCGRAPKTDAGEQWISFGGDTWFHEHCWRSKLRGRRTWKRSMGWKWLKQADENYDRVKAEYDRVRAIE